MPLYEITKTKLRPLPPTSFVDINMKEREDIQRLLRTQIEVLGEDLYVIAEEFSDWEDSKRRIDLLAIDKNAKIVVIELKRTNSGGHMELQAIRYASMVSAMTFEKAVTFHQAFLQSIDEEPSEAQQRILDFLAWDEADEELFATSVRIILASEDFNKELTTAVLWLREHDLDIQCIRMRPYKDNNQLLVDVQSIIPLPEAQAYQIQLKAKELKTREEKAERYGVRQRFWDGVTAIARRQNTIHANIKPGSYHWLGTKINGFGFNYVTKQHEGGVEVYIDSPDADKNTRTFEKFLTKKDDIEAQFGAPLSWEPLVGKRACRVKFHIHTGGYRNPESDWPALHNVLVDSMTRLEQAFTPYIS